MKRSQLIKLPDYPSGYSKTFLAEQLKIFGEDCFTNFLQWINGQTVGVENGQTIFYTSDVYRYLDQGGLQAEILD